MSVGKSIFTAESLSSAYGREEILREVSFSLEAGQLTALLGLNGCGKTTLMKCIAQRLSHDGCCKLKGEGLETMNTRQLAQRLSYIPQRSGDGMTQQRGKAFVADILHGTTVIGCEFIPLIGVFYGSAVLCDGGA